MYIIYALPQNIVYNPEEQVSMVTLKPINETHPETGVTLSTFDVSHRPFAADTLFIESLHSEVYIYTHGALIYSLKRGTLPWMSSTGTVYEMVYLPDDATTLDVEVRNLYPGIDTNRAVFHVGSGAEMSKVLSRTSFFPTMISAMDVILGILMLVCWYAFKRENLIYDNLYYLAFFAIAVGFWSMSESNNFILVISNQAAASFTSYMALMFFVVPFVQFTKHHYKYNPRFADVLSLSAIIAHLLIIVLHTTGMAGLKQTITLIHIHMAIGASFYVYCFIRHLRDTKKSLRGFVDIIAVIILIGSSIIDFIMYYTAQMQASFAGRFGLMIYIFILSTATVSDMAKNLQKANDAKIYKKLAFTDNLTDLYNRNAYIEWESNQKNPDPVTIINIDLNDLKKCNDTFGHISGDKYIADSAKIISNIFNDYGDCYRVGGDEFAVVIHPKYSEDQIKDRLSALENAQNEYNATSETIQMHMAYGYAKFDPKIDRSLEAVGTRADARMYAHKKILKKKVGITIR